MALNIPVNLMSTTALNSQPPVAAAAAAQLTTTIQPAGGSAGANASGANPRDSNSAGHPAFAAKRGTSTPAPDRAAPVSIVAAQTAPPAPETPEQSAMGAIDLQDAPRQTMELDRYAPPDPLPTAPILQAASSYAAKREALQPPIPQR